tara:strand:- start:5053 stop:5211 length:159 start_codon:yes stop_codon:yes gene_type:complete
MFLTKTLFFSFLPTFVSQSEVQIFYLMLKTGEFDPFRIRLNIIKKHELKKLH